MTAEQDNPENDAIDELTGRWFDSESAESFEDIHKSLDTKQIRRAGELQLVHSLLMQLADRDEAAKERRIDNLMQNIDTGNRITEKFYRMARPFVRYGIAAVLIIAAAIMITHISTNTAMAAIDKMISAIDQAGDRTYSITVEDGKRESRNPRPSDQPNMRKEPGERAGLDGATLYLQGSNKFVLYRRTPSGKTLINGSDGQTRWLIRPDKPVLVSNDPQAFRIPMPPELAAILSMDFKSTLQQIRDHYKVKYFKDAADANDLNNSLVYLDASKIGKDFAGPKNIEIWADRETGLLMRIEFADIHLQGDPSPMRLIIDLTDQKPQPENWFTHQAHHSPDTEIDLLPEN